jgi:hypothetical protein
MRAGNSMKHMKKEVLLDVLSHQKTGAKDAQGNP